MAEGTLRRILRRVIPRRVRWLARAAFRMTTGVYFRDMLRHVQVMSAQVGAQEEILDFMLLRLRRLEDETMALVEPVHRLQEEVAALSQAMHGLQEEVAALSQPLPNELSPRTADFLNFGASHLGFRARFGLWVNDPIAVRYTPEGVVRWVNTIERIVEIPFAFQALSSLASPARIIDIGAQESLIALELASLGHRVTALDIRSYAFAHPNLTVVKASILDWEGDGRQYDAAVLLSTLEHLGIPVYGQTGVDEDADERAMEKTHALLRPGGLLLLTTPFGPSHVEETQRIYSAADLGRLLRGFRVQQCRVARRTDEKTWVLGGDVAFASLDQCEENHGQESVVLIAAERE